MPSRLTRFSCALQRLLRRKAWLYLAPLLVLAYPVGWLLLISFDVTGLTGDELVQAIARQAGKTVDPLLFLCQVGIGLALFCIINGLGFGALKVVPVAVDWATGRYAKEAHYKSVGLTAPVRGFKYTFLTVSPLARILLYLIVWALELAVGAWSMSVAFSTI